MARDHVPADGNDYRPTHDPHKGGFVDSRRSYPLTLDDQNRTKRKRQTVNEYKREQLRKDVVELENTIEEQQTEIALNESVADEYIELALYSK